MMRCKNLKGKARLRKSNLPPCSCTTRCYNNVKLQRPTHVWQGATILFLHIFIWVVVLLCWQAKVCDLCRENDRKVEIIHWKCNWTTCEDIKNFNSKKALGVLKLKDLSPFVSIWPTLWTNLTCLGSGLGGEVPATVYSISSL